MPGAQKPLSLSIGGGPGPLDIDVVPDAAIAGKPAPTVYWPTRSIVGAGLPAMRPVKTPKKPTITAIDIHHRHECLPPRNRQRRITFNPTRNLVAEGRTMLIHLLTCLALTAFTLSVFAWFLLSEERTS
jgi:hypothetical protein